MEQETVPWCQSLSENIMKQDSKCMAVMVSDAPFQTILHHHASKFFAITLHFTIPPLSIPQLDWAPLNTCKHMAPTGWALAQCTQNPLPLLPPLCIIYSTDPTSETNAPSLLQHNISSMNLQDLLNAAPELYCVRLLSIFLWPEKARKLTLMMLH